MGILEFKVCFHFTNILVYLSYISMYHRDNGFTDWSVNVRDPVLIDKLNHIALLRMTAMPDLVQAAVDRFEQFSISIGYKACFTATSKIVEQWMDHLVFNEFASPDKLFQLIEQLCDHHTVQGLHKAWTQLIASPEIISRLEFLEEHFNDPIRYYSRLALFKKWDTGTNGNLIHSSTYDQFLKHQMNRCYHKLISLNDVHDSVELLGSYNQQCKNDWGYSVQYDRVLLDSISFPANRIPQNPAYIKKKQSASPESPDLRMGLPGVRAPRKSPKQTTQFGVAPAPSQRRAYAPQEAKLSPLMKGGMGSMGSGQSVDDIDRQFLNAIVKGVLKRKFEDGDGGEDGREKGVREE